MIVTRARVARFRSGALAGQAVPVVRRPAPKRAPQPRFIHLPTTRVSAIDPAFPVFGTPTTASVRDNFAAAKSEIEALQAGKLDLAGGTMTGPIGLIASQLIDGGPL